MEIINVNTGFNPILVRLKLNIVSPTKCSVHEFQSHIGPIKTCDKVVERLEIVNCFNPILVRLKQPG